MPPPASVAGYLPERASASVIPMPPPASLPKEMLRSDIKQFASTPGMFNRLPIALREARGSLVEQARPYTRSEIADLFKRNGVELTDNIWNNIKRIESTVPESLQVMRRGLPEAVNEVISGPVRRVDSLQQLQGRLPGFAEGTGYLPRYASGSDNVVGAAGSGATGVTPSDVSMGYLSGPAYDWYDAQTGSYGYGAFNPGNPEPNVSGVATPAPAGTLPAVQGAPATPITQQSIVDMARKWSPPRVSAVLGEQQVGPMQLPVQSASYRQTSNLTPEDVKAFGTRLAAEGTSLTDYSALQKGLFGAKRTSRRGRLVI
jgi:hypothetical protein